MNCDTQTDAGVTLPNKPMVPTAHNGFDEVPIDPLRRHIGNPLGSSGCSEQRWATKQAVGYARLATTRAVWLSEAQRRRAGRGQRAARAVRKCYRACVLRSRGPFSVQLIDGGGAATATMDLIGLPVRSPLVAM